MGPGYTTQGYKGEGILAAEQVVHGSLGWNRGGVTSYRGGWKVLFSMRLAVGAGVRKVPSKVERREGKSSGD